MKGQTVFIVYSEDIAVNIFWLHFKTQ